MNEAHIHMLVNHFPIIGLFFGLGVLLFGVVKKNLTLKSTAYVMLIICVIFGQLAMMTGDKAEHFVEDLPGFTHKIIHEHEEAAEAFMIPMYILGLVSIVGLYAQFKTSMRSHNVSKTCTKQLGKFLKKQSLNKQLIVEHIFVNRNR